MVVGENGPLTFFQLLFFGGDGRRNRVLLVDHSLLPRPRAFRRVVVASCGEMKAHAMDPSNF